MFSLFFIIFAIPSVILFFRHPEKAEIILQFLIVAILFFFGMKIFKFSGCARIVGIVMVGLALAGYYFLIVQPLLNGQIVVLGIF